MSMQLYALYICMQYVYICIVCICMQCMFTEQKNTMNFVNTTLLPLCLQKPMSSVQEYFLVMLFNQRLKEVPGFFQILAYEN